MAETLIVILSVVAVALIAMAIFRPATSLRWLVAAMLVGWTVLTIFFLFLDMS